LSAPPISRASASRRLSSSSSGCQFISFSSTRFRFSAL
jgi:hypothetical protein